MAYSTFTLTGTYRLFDGEACRGGVEIIPSVKTVKDTTGNVILAGRVKVSLEDSLGSFSVVLPNPNDSTLAPSGFGYTVVVKLDNSHTRIPVISFGANQVTGPTLDMEDVTPVDVSTLIPTVQYPTTADLANAIAGAIATAEAYTDGHSSSVSSASTTAQGIVELATNTETTTGTDTSRAVTPAGVKAAIDALIAGAPGALDTLNEIAAQLATDESAAGALTTLLTQVRNLTDPTIAASLSAAFAPVAPALAPPRVVFPKMRDTVISAFQSGHGWTKSGTGTMTDDTTDFAIGTQSVKLVTAGDGGSNYIKSPTLALDLTNQVLVAAVKIDDFAHYSDLQIRVSSNGFTDYAYIKPAYTGLTQRWVEPGKWTTITLSRAEVVAGMSWGNGQWQYSGVKANVNWANITGIWFKAVDDAVAPMTARVGLLSYFAKPTRPLLSIVFDDSRATHYTVARPVMDAYRLPATFATIFENLGTSGYMSMAQIQQMREQSKASFVCHADSNVAGVLAHQNGYDGLTAANGLSDVLSLKQKMHNNGLSGGNLICYPHGSWSINTPGIANPNPDVLGMMRRFFDLGRTTNSNTLETYPPADSHKLRSYTVGNTDTAAQLLSVLDQGIAANAWTIMQFHNLTTPASNASDCTPAVFQAFIDGVASRAAAGSVVVKTLQETLLTGAA